MTAKIIVATRPDPNGGTFAGGFLALAAMAALLLAAAAPAVAGAVKFESIPGSTVKRVILTAKAAERLGIELGKVSEQRIVRKQMFGGQVMHPLRLQLVQKRAKYAFAGFGQAAAQPAPKPIAIQPGET